MMMTSQEDMDAYETLTRKLTRMHASERDILDQSVVYRAALNAVIIGNTERAQELVTNIRTDAGDAWRAKQGITFWGEEI
jgi:hypothetical protein